MKRRKPLTRKTPMAPRKEWMNRQSDKKRKEKRDTDGPREEYRKQFRRCQCCRNRTSRETHEMASGGSRCKAVYHRETYLAVCRGCHKKIHRTSEWPYARQLWAKKRGDPAYYNRRLVNEIKGWDAEAVTEEDVDAWQPTR